MASPATWWWPKRPARVPRAGAAGLVAGAGAVLFGVAALLLHTAPAGWDVRLFRALNEVPPAAEAILTPLSRLFLPAGITAVAGLAAVYAVVRNRGALPVVAGGVAAGAAWALALVAKAVTARPRPYAAVAGVVLRQEPAHGLSFPSSHTAVALAAAIALTPFLARALAVAGIGYAVLVGWSRVYLGVHYPLDILGGAGIGIAAGGVVLLAVGLLLRRAGRAGDRGAAGQGQAGLRPSAAGP